MDPLDSGDGIKTECTAGLPNWKSNTCKCVIPRPWYSGQMGVKESRDAETGFENWRVGVGNELTVVPILHHGKVVVHGGVGVKGERAASYPL